MRSVFDIEYKQDLFIDLHMPDEGDFDLFVYFHGGGLLNGSRKDVNTFVNTLAKRNVATASVEYRMYPTAKFPDFIEDGACAIRYIKDNISKWGNCRRIFVGGSSAGGYISMMLCFDGRFLGAVGMKPTDIDGYIHDAGQPTAHYNVLKARGIDSRRAIVDETAPMYFIGTEEKYAPMLFIVSDNDIFARYEQTMLMVKTLEHFGHKENIFLTVMKGKHCEHTNSTDECGEGVFGNIVKSFIEKL